MKNIKNILFDCDGVLYQDLESVFGQVSKRMTQYISEKLKINLVEAKKLQTEYFHKYNTSLNGLMIHHDIPPKEFLNFVHDIDLSFMEKDLVLRGEIEKLDLRKFVFTNGSSEHVSNITTHLGIDDLFEDGVYEYLANVSEDSTYRPGQDLQMPSNDSLTPQHLEIIIFNKVLKILVEEGGFELDEHFRGGR